MSSRTYGRNAFETSLNGAIGGGDTSIALTSATGLTAPGYIVIEPGSPTKREYIKFTGISVNTLTGVTRGLDGSASGAQAHDDGTTVRMVFVHQYLNDIFTDIEALETADSNHFGGTDTSDHPEATTSVRGFMSAADKTKLDGIAAGAVADHGALSGLADDDHSQYVLADGTRAFTGEVAGVTPTLAASLATKGYVDGEIVADHGALTGLADDDHTQYYNAARHTKAVHDALGIDADTVDGQHASAFATSGHNHDTEYIRDDTSQAIQGHFDPTADNTYDLGDATRTWRRLYAHAVYDENGALRIDTSARHLAGGSWEVTGGQMTATQFNTASAALGSSLVLNNGDVFSRDGSAASPSYRFATGTTGLYYNAGVGFSVGGSPAITVELNGITPHVVWNYDNSFGSIRWAGTGANLRQAHTSSSEKHKKQIQAVKPEDAVFMQMHPIWFKYREDHPHKDRFVDDSWERFENPHNGRMGFSFEQLAADPATERFVYEVDGMEAVSYEGMLPDFMAWATAAIQDLYAKAA